MKQPAPVRIRLLIPFFALTRGVLNTGFRMVYPFLPAIARGLGVDLEAVALAVTIRSTVGLASPLLASSADQRGRKAMMLFGLGLFTGGLLLVTFWPTYLALVAALLLSAAGKLIFDATMQAYIGDQVAYARRGLAIAISELGWSGSFIVGIPLVGWLIARAGWSAPFPILAGLALIAAILLYRILPADAPAPEDRPSLQQNFRAVLIHRAAVAALTVSLLTSAANEVVNIIYGAWIEDAFGLQVAALGAASAVIGLAELGGEGLVAALTDRLGKRLAVGLGIGLNALACLALPLLARSLAAALVGLFLFFITFEFMIVSSFSLLSELLPQARATLMAGNFAALSGGRALGALIGPLLFPLGLMANSVSAVALNGLALALLFLFVQVEQERRTPAVETPGQG